MSLLKSIIICAVFFLVTNQQINSAETAKIRAKRQSQIPYPFFNAIHSLINSLDQKKAADVVIIIGRHKTIGKRLFYSTARPIFISILKQYASIQKDYARLAVLTYGKNFSVDYDDISTPSVSVLPKNKCELFPPDANTQQPLDVVLYKDADEQTSCAIQGALNKASDIFMKGSYNRSPPVSKILILMTDGNFIGCNFNAKTMPEITTLKNQNVIIHGIGYGQPNYVDEATITSMVSSYLSSSLYADSMSWNQTLFYNPLIVSRSNMPFLDPASNKAACSSINIYPNSPNANCYCDIDYGYYRKLCDLGYYDNGYGMCQACPRNTYKPFIGKESCLPCFPNYITNSEASTSQKDCIFVDKTKTNYSNPCINIQCGDTKICQGNFDGLTLKGYDCSQCYPGFDRGTNCATSINDCSSSTMMCANGGLCVDGWMDFSCSCPTGFYGKTCQNSYNSCRFTNLCGANGRCVVTPSYEGQFYCQCNPAYMGEFCELNIIPVTQAVPTTTTTTTLPTTMIMAKNEIPGTSFFPNAAENPPTTEQANKTNVAAVAAPVVVCLLLLLALLIGYFVYKFWYVKKQNNSKLQSNLISTSTEHPYMASNPLSMDSSGLHTPSSFSRDISVDSSERKNSFYEMAAKTTNGTLDKRLFDRASKMYGPETIKDGNMMGGVPKAPLSITIDDDGQVQLNLPLSISTPTKTLNDWSAFLTDLTSDKALVGNALLADIHKNQFVATDGWANFRWDEILSLDTAIGNDGPIDLRGNEYILGRPKNRTVVGKMVELVDCLDDSDNISSKILILGRSKNYLFALVGGDEKIGTNLVQNLINHIVKEGH